MKICTDMQISMKLIYSWLRYLSHHLTYYCSRIYDDLHRYERKIVFVNGVYLKLFRNNNENDFVQIFINPETIRCQMKADSRVSQNFGLISENMDLSNIHLAVKVSIFYPPLKANVIRESSVSMIPCYEQPYLWETSSVTSFWRGISTKGTQVSNNN